MKYTTPIIIEEDIEVKTRGRYKTESGRPRGLVIHYTAGRYKEVSDAKHTLSYLANDKLGCMVMDYYGGVHKAANQSLDEVAFHAGHSSWMKTPNVSWYCMGMEVCNAGTLSDVGESWYGEKIPLNEWSRVIYSHDNVKAGVYHKFSKAQERALINFCLWQLDTNPEFDVEWVVGHDEIAPKRKTDPGGSLSVSMPEFRQMLRHLHCKEK